MSEAFIRDAVHTPIGKLNGALSIIRADDLAAIPLRALVERNQRVDWQAVDDVLLDCAAPAAAMPWRSCASVSARASP